MKRNNWNREPWGFHTQTNRLKHFHFRFREPFKVREILRPEFDSAVMPNFIARALHYGSLFFGVFLLISMGETVLHAQPQGRFELFTGCETMGLVVEGLPEDARSISLSVERITNSVESRLRSAKLFSSSKNQRQYLYVNINVIANAYDISVGFNKRVFDPRSGLSSMAITWYRGSTGTHDQDASFIISNLSEHIDAFIVEYLRVNEQECSEK